MAAINTLWDRRRPLAWRRSRRLDRV